MTRSRSSSPSPALAADTVVPSIGLGLVAPVVIALVGLAPLWWFDRRVAARDEGSERRGWAALVARRVLPLLLAAAYVTAHAGVANALQFPPQNTSDRLGVLGIAAGIVGLLLATRRWPWWIALPARVLVAGGAVWLLAHRKLELEVWTAVELAWQTLLLALAPLVLWSSLDRVDRELPGSTAPLAAAAVAGGSVPVLILVGRYDSAGWLAVALGLALGVSALFLRRRRGGGAGLAMHPGGTAVAGLLLPMLWIAALLWSELDWWYLPLLALGPACVAIRAVPPIGRLPGWARFVVGVAAAAALPTIAAILAVVLRAPDYEAFY